MSATPQEERQPRTSEYLLWVFAVAANGLLGYMWCVFGAAAAGNSNNSARNFLVASAIAIAIPFALSLFFIAMGRFNAAMLAICATLPMLVLSMFVLGWVT